MGLKTGPGELPEGRYGLDGMGERTNAALRHRSLRGEG